MRTATALNAPEEPVTLLNLLFHPVQVVRVFLRLVLKLAVGAAVAILLTPLKLWVMATAMEETAKSKESHIPK